MEDYKEKKGNENLMKTQELQAYELIRQEALPDIHSVGYLFRHKASGARIMFLENEDDNKVFHVTFRTPPSDSTGVAHILEHCTLCGSEKFPSKDPFVELAKGSLNTFLNAMTYPDKTMYPVASCNDRDFANLMDVYLDAVFHTNIYKKEEIFRQEGWSYQLDSQEEELTYNGVVYNEMKGAFSSPEDVLDREILNALYPDTPYGFESGGDPAHIPDLKYEDFLDFHRKYYHPSNAWFYFYGNMDICERLQWLDREYLSHYEKKTVDSQIAMQPAFESPREVYRKYPISMAEPEENNTFLSWNVSVGVSSDAVLAAAFSVLEYALLQTPGAPLRQALLDAGIGKDVFGSYDSGIRQPFFSVVAKNANVQEKERFVGIIHEVLERQARDGIDRRALAAGIHSAEFRFREADYGTYPKGLMYGIDIMDAWLYDEEDPFAYVKRLQIFEKLKELADTDYFEGLIRRYLLENHHTAIVIVEPERGLASKVEAQTAEKLAAYKDSLSEAELRHLVEQTEKLRIFQETPSTPEELEKIPLLERSDITTEIRGLSNIVCDWDGTPVLWHDIPTNGIAYLELLFDLKCVPAEDIPYVGILRNVLGMVDTAGYSYGDLFHQIHMQTGGISMGLQWFADSRQQGNMRAMFSVQSKALYEKTDFVINMIEEILFTSAFGDEKRLYEIIAEQKSRTQMRLQSAGHAASLTRSLAYASETSAFQDLTGGIACYQLLEDLEQHFEEKKKFLADKLMELAGKIFRKDAMTVSITASEEGISKVRPQVEKFARRLPQHEQKIMPWRLAYGQKNEGFQTSAKIQYVSRTGNFRKAGYAYTGALRILKVIMGYEYLWVNVRVRGGAYGCMCGFGRNGDSYFTSYRDPNLVRTNEIYEGIPDYVEHFEADEREMTKYVIGTVSEIDTPLTARALGMRSLQAYYSQITEEDLRRERQEILNAKPEDIRALAPLMRAVLADGNLCVIGNEDVIAKENEMFAERKPL